MNMKKITASILVFTLMLCACSSDTTTKQSIRDESVSFEKLSWKEEATTYEQDSFRYYLKKTTDDKYSWLTKVEVMDKEKAEKMNIPDEMDGTTLLRIGFDTREIEEGQEIGYNLFGNTIEVDRIVYKTSDEMKRIQEINIPDSVQSIEEYTFAGVFSIKHMKLPQDLKQLGGGSFLDCTGLADIEIGDKLEELQPTAFSGCDRLDNIRISADNSNYYEQGGFIINRTGREAVMAVPAKEDLMIPKDVQTFGKQCFVSSNVKQIDIEERHSILAKEDDCIYRQDNNALVIGIVKNGILSISDKVKELNQDSLLAGEKVKRIEISPSLVYLRGAWLDMVGTEECDYVFYGDKAPQIVEPSESTSMVPIDGKIMVPKKALSQYRKWLKENGGDETRLVPMESQSMSQKPQVEQEIATSTEDMFEVKDGILLRYKGGYQKETKIVLPKSVKAIGGNAFSLNKKEKKVVTGLKVSYLDIPGNVKLKKNAFTGTGPLKVNLLEGRKKVEKSAFRDMGKYGCESEITLADSIQIIGEYALCVDGGVVVNLSNKLQRVEKFGLNGASIRSLPDSLKYLGEEALGYQGRAVHKMPGHLEELGTSCIRLYGDRIHIPASVRHIALNAVVWEECNNADVQGYDVDPGNPYYKSDENGWLYSKDGKILYYAYRLKSEDDIVIPQGVEKVYKEGLYLYDDDYAPGERARIIGKERVKVI